MKSILICFAVALFCFQSFAGWASPTPVSATTIDAYVKGFDVTVAGPAAGATYVVLDKNSSITTTGSGVTLLTNSLGAYTFYLGMATDPNVKMMVAFLSLAKTNTDLVTFRLVTPNHETYNAIDDCWPKQ